MIGYYAHHQGQGHVRRARAIAARLGEDVVVLSSHAPQPWAAGWVHLARDDDADLAGTDPTAGGRLHWAPQASPGYRDRMATIADWVRTARPRAVVVDVSVEVTALVRLLGVPVMAVAMPGSRADAPHVLGYDLADRLLAQWPVDLGVDDSLRPYLAKTDETGLISLFDGRPVPAPTPRDDDRRTVLLLSGGGGSAITAADLERARDSTPGWRWRVVGSLGEWVEDVWPLLHEADVVVTAAGQNSVADVATARRPAVVLPEDRPHGEQHATADLLERTGIATVVRAWPEDWAPVLDAAARVPDRWHLLRPDGAAERAAAALEALR